MAILLHWTVAALVFAQLGGGFLMTHYVQDLALKFRLYQLHKSIGATILALMLARIMWRLATRQPPWPDFLRQWERRLAGLVQAMLYILLTALPLSGWARVSAAPLAIPTMLYGLIPAPHILFLAQLPLEEKKALEPLLKNVHSVLGWAVLALAALHVAAAVRHIILQDGVMSRMLPRCKKTPLSPSWIFGAGIAALMALQAVSIRPAQAVEWSVDASASSVGFEAAAGGQTIKGAFKRFTAEIDFDPDAPESSHVRVAIDLSSASTGTAEVDQALPSPDWFDVKQYAQATLRSTSIKSLGSDRYELHGELSIRNASRPIVLPFALHVDDDGQAVAEGKFTVSRADFGVGPASPVGGMAVGDAVQVSLKVSAQRLDN